MVLPHSPLCVHLGGPLLHGVLGVEANYEILDAGVALPENLTGIGPGFLERDCLRYVLHEDAAFELEPSFAGLGGQRFVHLFGLVGAQFLATEEYHLEKVNFVLE